MCINFSSLFPKPHNFMGIFTFFEYFKLQFLGSKIVNLSKNKLPEMPFFEYTYHKMPFLGCPNNYIQDLHV